MISIVGILVVFGAVIGGFMMEKGQLGVLIQPAELVTIGGAALGTLLAANPIHILKGSRVRHDGDREWIPVL